MRGTVMLFERVKVGTALPATPDANCSKTIAMCKACNVLISDWTCPDLAFVIMWVKVHDILGYFCTRFYSFCILKRVNQVQGVFHTQEG